MDQFPKITSGNYEAFLSCEEHEEPDLAQVPNSVVTQVTFNKIMAYIVKCFPEAQGIKSTALRPAPPVAQLLQEDVGRLRHTRSDPFGFLSEPCFQGS